MKAVKVRIYPNKTQKELIEKHFGACRFVYNLGLELKVKTYNDVKKNISTYEISALLPKLKKQEETQWLKEINSQALQQSLKDLDSAFSRFFKKYARFPQFKSKRNPKQSFRIPQGFELNNETRSIRLPKIGWIKFRDKYDFKDEDIRSITVNRNGQDYFASILLGGYDLELKPPLINLEETVGIDLGVKVYATFSDGIKIQNEKFLSKELEGIKKASELLSKKQRGSNNHNKQKEILRKKHLKVANKRKDFLHKLTNGIVENQNYTSIAIEDLMVQELLDGYKATNRAIGDCGWRMFRNILEYKCKRKGKNLLVINRFDASSKTCICGKKNENLTLEDREWTCFHCGARHDRDLLAANNIKLFAVVGQTAWKGASPEKEPQQL